MNLFTCSHLLPCSAHAPSFSSLSLLNTYFLFSLMLGRRKHESWCIWSSVLAYFVSAPWAVSCSIVLISLFSKSLWRPLGMIAKMLNKNFTAKGTLDWIYEYASGDLVVTLSVAYSSELETCFYTQTDPTAAVSVSNSYKGHGGSFWGGLYLSSHDYRCLSKFIKRVSSPGSKWYCF